MVLFRKGLNLKIKAVFPEPEGELVVQDVSGIDIDAFRLMRRQGQIDLITLSVWRFPGNILDFSINRELKSSLRWTFRLRGSI